MEHCVICHDTSNISVFETLFLCPGCIQKFSETPDKQDFIRQWISFKTLRIWSIETSIKRPMRLSFDKKKEAEFKEQSKKEIEKLQVDIPILKQHPSVRLQYLFKN